MSKPLRRSSGKKDGLPVSSSLLMPPLLRYVGPLPPPSSFAAIRVNWRQETLTSCFDKLIVNEMNLFFETRGYCPMLLPGGDIDKTPPADLIWAGLKFFDPSIESRVKKFVKEDAWLEAREWLLTWLPPYGFLPLSELGKHPPFPQNAAYAHFLCVLLGSTDAGTPPRLYGQQLTMEQMSRLIAHAATSPHSKMELRGWTVAVWTPLFEPPTFLHVPARTKDLLEEVAAQLFMPSDLIRFACPLSNQDYVLEDFVFREPTVVSCILNL